MLNVCFKRAFNFYKIMANNNNKTRQSILDSACLVFSEKGYHRATIDEICKAAGANIALVNYYFGDKASLYDAVWKQSFDCTSKKFPLDGGSGGSGSPQERLGTVIHAMLKRVFATDNCGIFSRLMVQEMACPTLTLSNIVDRAIRPQSDHICSILRELLGGDKIEQRIINEYMISIMGQCIIFASNRPLRSQLLAKNDFFEKDVERLADHITRFSLAGLEAAKRDPNQV